MGYMIRKHFLLPQTTTTTTTRDTIMAKKREGGPARFHSIDSPFHKLLRSFCHRPIEKISHSTTYAQICVSAETFFDVWAADFLAETGSLYERRWHRIAIHIRNLGKKKKKEDGK